MPQSKETIGWLSSARYDQPLESTTEKKWRMMAESLNYQFIIIGFSSGLLPQSFKQHVNFLLLPQPPTAILRYLTFFLLTPLITLWLILARDVQILVAQSPFEGAVGAFAKQASRLFGCKISLIVENHNNFEADLFLQRKIPLAKLYRYLMMGAAKYAFHHADVLRVISQSTHDRAAYFAPNRPMVRFMTWSDTDIFRETQRAKPLADCRDFVYAGVLIPRKGVHHLLEAFSKLNTADSQLYLVGHPENAHYAAELQQQAQTLGIAERVHFVGGVDQRRLAQYLADARAMILPSLSEGLGRVVVEAMLVGTPVIASRVGGIPDMITDGENGYLVTPEAVDELSEAMQQMLVQPNISEMGEKARNFAQGFFSPEGYVAGYGELFSIAESQLARV